MHVIRKNVLKLRKEKNVYIIEPTEKHLLDEDHWFGERLFCFDLFLKMYYIISFFVKHGFGRLFF